MGLFEMHLGGLRQALSVAGPEVCDAGCGDAPAHLKGLRRNQWAHAAIGKATQGRFGVRPAERAQVQGGDQRAMHHQAGIAFGAGDIGVVVMDAVAVERDGAVAEQQGRRRLDGLCPFALGQCVAAARLGWRGFAVDDVLFLADGQATVLGIVMAHGDE